MDVLVRRQDVINVILSDKIDDTSLEIITALGDRRLALTLNSTCDRHIQEIEKLPSTQKKGYTKADYIMALHKEYGCSLSRAEEAHQKALEYLRNASIIKG